MSALITSLVGIAGTLSGGALTGYIQSRAARAQRVDAHRRAQQDGAVDAVAELVAAIDAHRAKMWTMENQRHENAQDGEPAPARPEAVDATIATRAAISTPLTRVCLLLPTLAPLARAAVKATYELHNSTSAAKLKTLRDAAIAAAAEFTDTAAVQLAAAGVGLSPALPASKQS